MDAATSPTPPQRRGRDAEDRIPDGKHGFSGTVISVKDHHAKGDGKKDDTAALEAAIAASDAGDALYFPPGTYVVSRSLRPKAHQLYFSLTDEATVKAHPDETAFPIFDVHAGRTEFRRLGIDGTRNDTLEPSEQEPAAGIWVHDVEGPVDLVVSACRIVNLHDEGIRVVGGRDLERGADRVLVRDTIVQGCGGNGLSCGRVDHVRVESSRFEECNNGIKMLGCNDVVVHGVTANSNRRHGIVFTFSHRWHVDDCFAAGNGSDGEGWGIAAGGEPLEGLEPNSDFTITNNICGHNADGGITLDPTMKPEPGEEHETIFSQRARVSGNVCRNSAHNHGIHVTHASDVVVTDNVCCDNAKGSGIQLVSSSHVLVQGNACFGNRNGIGLFSDRDVVDPGHHLIGINMLYENTKADVRHQEPGQGQPLVGVRIHGLHGGQPPEGIEQAEPGTLYEWHDRDAGALYVKAGGSGTAGWLRVAADDGS